MAVWRVQELHKGRKGGLSEGVQRKYTRVFRVRTNSKTDGPIQVMFGVDPDTGEFVPRLYSSYFSFGTTEYDILAICRSVDPVQDEDDWTIWLVTCEYSTVSPNGDMAGQPNDGGNPGTGSGASNDPELEPPVIRWSRWSKEVVQEREAGGDKNAILNSANQRFDPMVTRQAGGRILIVERNENVFDSLEKDAYSFAINDLPFIEEDDENQWLCFPITADRVYKGPLSYWRVHYEFHHCGFPFDDEDAANPPDWHHHLLDQGYGILDAAGNFKVALKNGQIPAQPIPLNGEGGALRPGFLGEDPVYLTFIKYRRMDFGPLAIEVPF